MDLTVSTALSCVGTYYETLFHSISDIQIYVVIHNSNNYAFSAE